MTASAAALVRLRWRLLGGAVRHGGTEQVGAVLSIVASFVVGASGAVGLAVAGRSSGQPEHLAIVLCSLLLVLAVGFGIVAGVSQPIDPRVIAAEPLSDRDRSVGLLAAAAVGPPGLAGVAIGVGLTIGMARGTATLPVIALAATSWLLSLLLAARTATNLLAMMTSRFPRAGQIAVAAAGFGFYGLFQVAAPLIGSLDEDGTARLADALAWGPPGQIGRALGTAGTVESLWHLLAGTVWIPVLVVAYAWSERELSLTVRRAGGLDTDDAEAGLVGRTARWLCGGGAVGTIAWRSILTRFRTTRTALETFTGAGVGMAAVLAPGVARDDAGSGAVLIGGAVQLAVLFMSGNSFGADGPALTHELLAGADPATLVRGKARSIAIVASPLVVLGPLLAAALTDEWTYLVAGFGVGVGALLAGSGAAVVQSAYVPIAIPDSDNPFASGESGKGIVAALLLVVVLTALAMITLPVGLALFWATDRDRAGLVTLFSALTVAVGLLVMRGGIRLATRRLAGREPEFVASVTPAR